MIGFRMREPSQTQIDFSKIQSKNSFQLYIFKKPKQLGLSQVACDIIFLCLDRVNLTLLVVTFRH